MAHRHGCKAVSSPPADSQSHAQRVHIEQLHRGLGVIYFDCLTPLQTYRTPVLSCSFYQAYNESHRPPFLPVSPPSMPQLCLAGFHLPYFTPLLSISSFMTKNK